MRELSLIEKTELTGYYDGCRGKYVLRSRKGESAEAYIKGFKRGKRRIAMNNLDDAAVERAERAAGC